MSQRDARMLSRYPGPNQAQHPAPGAGCGKVRADQAGQGQGRVRSRGRAGAGAGRGGAGRGAGGALGRAAPGDFEPSGPGSRCPRAWRAGSGSGCCWRTPSSWCWSAGGGSPACGGKARPAWACCGAPAWWWGCECGAGGARGEAGSSVRGWKAPPERRPGFPVPSSNSTGRAAPKRLWLPRARGVIQVQAIDGSLISVRGRVPCR